MSEIKCHVCGFIGSSADCLGWEHTCTDIMKDKNKDLEHQLAEAREFIEIVGKYGDCSNPLMAISRIMKHYDKLKEQADE